MEWESRILKESEGRKNLVSRYPIQFKLPKGTFLQESLWRGMLLDYYLPAIECLCSDVTVHTEVQQKNSNEKMPLVVRQVFLLVSCSYFFLQQRILIKTLESGKISYRISWFQAEGMNENCNHKCFPKEFLQELCSLLPLLQPHNPTERKSDEISGGSRWLKALNSPKPCQGYQEREHLEPGNSLAKER